MDRVLNVVLVVGWITGCFPSRNPLPASPNFKFQWFGLVTTYTVLTEIYYLFASADMNLSNDNVSMSNFNHDLLSNRIILYTQSLVWYICDVLRKLLLILFCPRIIRLVKGMAYLGQRTAWKQDQIDSRALNYQTVYLILIAVAVTVHFSVFVLSRVLMFIAADESIVDFIHLSFHPRNTLFYTAAYLANSIFPFFSFYFVLGFASLFGLRLLELYENMCGNIISKSIQTETSKSDKFLTKPLRNVPVSVAEHGGISLDDFRQDFTLLRTFFDEFGQMAGILIFINTTTSVVRVISVSCTFLFGAGKQDFFSLVMTFANTGIGVFVIILKASLGQTMTNKMGRARQQLRDAVWSSSCSQEYKRAMKWVTSWEWKLTAMNNMLIVDNTLLPAIVAFVMTYIIFIFQLAISGN